MVLAPVPPLVAVLIALWHVVQLDPRACGVPRVPTEMPNCTPCIVPSTSSPETATLRHHPLQIRRPWPTSGRTVVSSQSHPPSQALIPSCLALRDALVPVWRTSNRVTVFLIEHLPPELWAAIVPGAPRRTVRMIAGHIHNARCMWIKTLGKAHGIAVPEPVDRRRVASSTTIQECGRLCGDSSADTQFDSSETRCGHLSVSASIEVPAS
jgi:hypothetical protein